MADVEGSVFVLVLYSCCCVFVTQIHAAVSRYRMQMAVLLPLLSRVVKMPKVKVAYLLYYTNVYHSERVLLSVI